MVRNVGDAQIRQCENGCSENAGSGCRVNNNKIIYNTAKIKSKKEDG